MGQQFEALEERHCAFIARQKIFFVGTAAPASRVNVSPKGMDSFRILGPQAAAYIDSTGSGSETAAHLAASSDRRITIMFCAFEGEPMILRLYGRGTSRLRGSDDYKALLSSFEELPGARQIVTIDIDLVQSSCGMAVPLYDYAEEREALSNYWGKRSESELKKYWSIKNTKSIDGHPTHFDGIKL
jgi:hypothetical protein